MFFNYRVTENVNEKRKTHVKIGCVCFFVLKDIVGTKKKKKTVSFRNIIFVDDGC